MIDNEKIEKALPETAMINEPGRAEKAGNIWQIIISQNEQVKLSMAVELTAHGISFNTIQRMLKIEDAEPGKSKRRE